MKTVLATIQEWSHLWEKLEHCTHIQSSGSPELDCMIDYMLKATDKAPLQASLDHFYFRRSWNRSRYHSLHYQNVNEKNEPLSLFLLQGYREPGYDNNSPSETMIGNHQTKCIWPYFHGYTITVGS